MAVTEWMEGAIKTREEDIKRKNEADIASIDSSIDQGIKKSGGSNSPMNAETPPETVSKELGIVSGMKGEAQALANNTLQEAKSFFTNIPIKDAGYQLIDFYPNNLAGPSPDYKLLKAWATAYNAYKISQVYSEMASRLKTKEDALTAITAEQSRIAAQAEAKRVADKAAVDAAAKAAADKAAADAAAMADADKAAADAAAKAAADKAAADAAAKAAADKAAADAAAKAAAAAQLIKVANTFRIPAATGAAQLSAAAGSIALTPGSTLTLEAAIQAGIQALKAVGSVALDRATGIGIGLLVYSPTLGNSDLYPSTTVTLPAKSLAPDLPASLPEVAATGGTVDVPYRIYGDSTKYSVIATQPKGAVSPKVPVRALKLDPALNAYTFTTADTPPRTLVFPIATPGSSSTTTPAKPVDVPVYTGVTLTPIEVKAEALPAADQLDIRDCIYCFPANSGLPPIYAVFSSPYEGATTKGEHSGRMYNPDKAGGPTQNLDWTTASVTQEGIDLVKLHTGRFPPSDANKIMIDRLEKIFRGEILITDIDKRFYAHEIRELERYRTLGVADGVEGKVWNNAHTATLEDYKVKESRDPMYTEAAKIAGDKQDYADALKGK